jgi:hypothetical protein
MTPAPKSLARGGLFCCSTLISEAIFIFACPDVFGKNGVGAGVRFMICRLVLKHMRCPRSAPEVSRTTYSGPFPTHYDQQSLKHKIVIQSAIRNRITDPITIPIKNVWRWAEVYAGVLPDVPCMPTGHKCAPGRRGLTYCFNIEAQASLPWKQLS